MKRYEYRREPVQFVIGKANADVILEALNRLGQDGWRLCQIESGLINLSWKGGVYLLLEREMEDDE